MGYFIRVQFVHQLMNSSFIIIYPSTCLYSLSLSCPTLCLLQVKASNVSDFFQLSCLLPSLSLVPERPRCFVSQLSLPAFGTLHSCTWNRCTRKGQKGVKFVLCLGHLGILFCHTSSYPDGNGLWTFSLTFSYSSHWQVHYFLTTRSLCQG